MYRRSIVVCSAPCNVDPLTSTIPHLCTLVHSHTSSDEARIFRSTMTEDLDGHDESLPPKLELRASNVEEDAVG